MFYRKSAVAHPNFWFSILGGCVLRCLWCSLANANYASAAYANSAYANAAYANAAYASAAYENAALEMFIWVVRIGLFC